MEVLPRTTKKMKLINEDERVKTEKWSEPSDVTVAVDGEVLIAREVGLCNCWYLPKAKIELRDTLKSSRELRSTVPKYGIQI